MSPEPPANFNIERDIPEPDKGGKRYDVVGLETLYLPSHDLETSFCSALAKALIASVAYPPSVAELGQQDIDVPHPFL